jgi:hypothetical protein
MYLWPYQVGGGGVISYVSRPDPGTEDADLTMGLIVDGNWHEWDYTAIAPPTAKLLLIQTFAIQGTQNITWALRHKGDTSMQRAMNNISQTDGCYFGNLGFVEASSTGKIEYMFQNAGTWYWAEWTIVGWFL